MQKDTVEGVEVRIGLRHAPDALDIVLLVSDCKRLLSAMQNKMAGLTEVTSPRSPRRTVTFQVEDIVYLVYSGDVLEFEA